MNVLNLFYEELDPDRWLPLDRYPRRVIRRIVRGRPRPGGQMQGFLNFCAGLDRLGALYRINDYRYAKLHPDELVCIFGKPHVLDRIKWQNPILFGAAVYSHPLNDPDLLERLPIQKILVPGEWMRKMCEQYWGDKVAAWPVGIDTERWKPKSMEIRDRRLEHGDQTDFLIYDKIRWEHDCYESELITPIRQTLGREGLTFRTIRYGHYGGNEKETFLNLLGRCRAMIFLCEHETQGLAYQQALSCGVPILAWDRGGFWQDPEFYPHRVKFEPVSSVPYWDDRCGIKFENFSQFPDRLNEFWLKLQERKFQPRDYILENLTLEKCSQDYVDMVNAVKGVKRS